MSVSLFTGESMQLIILGYVFMYSIHNFIITLFKSVSQKTALYIFYTITESIALVIFIYLYNYKLYNNKLHYILCFVKYTYAIKIDKHITSSLLFHHYIVLFLLLVCYRSNLDELTLLGLTLTSFSNPLLSLSKTLQENENKKYAIYSFVCFIITYIITRIIMFPILICKTSLYLNVTNQIYIINNIFISIIYALQWYWLNGIFHILQKHIKLK